MPKCPYCGAEVERLFVEKKILYTVKLGEGQLIYTEKGRETLYRCPNCWRVIARSEAEAERFLSGQ
jgi:DNA-directed RNA polymerase subunit RPC12/RpoP